MGSAICRDQRALAPASGPRYSLLCLSPEAGKMIHATNAVEKLNAKLRRSARSRGHFPSEEAAMKLIWLQLREIIRKGKLRRRDWAAAKSPVRSGVR